MTITTPSALLLLLIILPIIFYFGWPRMQFRRVRDSMSLLLRTVIMLLIVLALAGTQVVQSADRLAVVYLLDSSDSMSANAQSEALDYIEASMESMEPDDRSAIVVFGENAQVARTMSSARELAPVRASPSPGNTDLASAVRLGLALFPDDAARRLVVLSDGEPTIGDWQSAAQLASAADVEISYVPFNRAQGPEVQVRDVDVPSVLSEDQEFTLTATIQSQRETPATLTVFASGEIITRQEIDLRTGVNNYSVRLRSGSAGFRDFEVEVDPQDGDTYYQNNRLAAVSQVEGTPRVLVVDGSAAGVDESRSLVTALEETGLAVDIVSPGSLPATIEGLAPYRSVIMTDVPATQLTNQRMQAIKTYVSDLGGGLVTVGGPNAYGPGGYYETPLADALPVEMQIKDQQRLPELTIAYVIDRSGSMGATSPSGIPHIDLAKEAIIRSLDFLQPTDRAAVVSFDQDAYWVAEFQEVQERTRLQRQVATLRPGGGTSIINGMELVANDILSEPADRKHIILLTDGGANRANLVELTENLNESGGVTTSVISIGQSEAGFLEEMAEVGEGNYHNVTDADKIPNIFTVEAVLATRTYIQEDTFTPTLSAQHPIMQGINAAPPLEGYVTTTERNAAQVILRGPGPYRDPILAAWQFGLGRSVSFMSDATSRWSQAWVDWDGFATFWSQAVRWTITEGASANLETRVQMSDTQARVIVDARDSDGAFLNGLDLNANVINGNEGTAESLSLRQVAPGRYEATFTPEEEGAYFVRVADQSGAAQESGLNLSQTTGWVRSYSAEYDIQSTGQDVLEQIADLTGGGDISESPSGAFAPPSNPNAASLPIWPWLLLAAMVLLPLDVAVRRLLVTRSDLARLRSWVFDRSSREPTDAEAARRMTTLLQARDRVRSSTRQSADEPETATTAGRLRNLRQQEVRSGVTSRPPADDAESDSGQGQTQRRSSTPRDQQSKGGDENIGSRLLKRRRTDDDNEG